MDINIRKIYIFTSFIIFCFLLIPCSNLNASSALSASDFTGKNICEVESKWHAYGEYQGFVKDPDYIEFASVKANDGNSYVFVVKKTEKDRCSWTISSAIKIGKATGNNETPLFTVSFNCTVIGKKYNRYAGYFGLIPFGSLLEYPHPTNAWSIDMNSMSFSKIKTTNVYCPNFLAD